VLPWLWRASHYGLQSDLAQSMVFSSLEIDSDLDIVVVAISLPSRSWSGRKTGNNWWYDYVGSGGHTFREWCLGGLVSNFRWTGKQGLFTTAFDLRSIPSFARLIRILLRLMAFLETRSSKVPGSGMGYIVFDAYLMSWSNDIEMPLEGT